MPKERPSIPTDEDFARAHAYMAAQNRMFATIRAKILGEFTGRAPLHEIWFFPSHQSGFVAHVFYISNSDIENCRGSHVEGLLRDAISQEFAALGGEPGVRPTVQFQFDSHENVKDQFNGNYDKYFR